MGSLPEFFELPLTRAQFGLQIAPFAVEFAFGGGYLSLRSRDELDRFAVLRRLDFPDRHVFGKLLQREHTYGIQMLSLLIEDIPLVIKSSNLIGDLLDCLVRLSELFIRGSRQERAPDLHID